MACEKVLFDFFMQIREELIVFPKSLASFTVLTALEFFLVKIKNSRIFSECHTGGQSTQKKFLNKEKVAINILFES